MIKRTIKKIIHNFGYDVKKINKEIKNDSFDEILKKNINSNSVIFDIGANKGQSIERFSQLFVNPTIHYFEPISDEFKELKKEYQNNKNVYLNNFALGEKKEIKEINITALSQNSSFNKINLRTKWLKTRSKQSITTEDGYVKKIEKVNALHRKAHTRRTSNYSREDYKMKIENGRWEEIEEMEYIDNKMYDLLGREFYNYNLIPKGTMYIKNRKKFIK